MEQNLNLGLNVLTVRMSDGNVIKLEHYNTLPSVAKLARDYARAGYPDRYVVFAENQSTSNITQTKLKEGECEHGVFLSCILRPSFFPSQAGFLGAMTGVSVIEGISEYTSKHLGLGWISDVYCEGKKIGGSQIEGKLDSFSSYEYLIVTFAVRLDEENFPPRLTDMIRKVFESENTSIPMIIAKSILNKFFSLYPFLKTPAKFMEDYRRRFLLRGVKIRYLKDGKKKRCKILGVSNENGSLMVETKGGSILHIGSRASVLIPNRIKVQKEKKRRLPLS